MNIFFVLFFCQISTHNAGEVFWCEGFSYNKRRNNITLWSFHCREKYFLSFPVTYVLWKHAVIIKMILMDSAICNRPDIMFVIRIEFLRDVFITYVTSADKTHSSRLSHFECIWSNFVSRILLASRFYSFRPRGSLISHGKCSAFILHKQEACILFKKYKKKRVFLLFSTLMFTSKIANALL